VEDFGVGRPRAARNQLRSRFAVRFDDASSGKISGAGSDGLVMLVTSDIRLLGLATGKKAAQVQQADSVEASKIAVARA